MAMTPMAMRLHTMAVIAMRCTMAVMLLFSVLLATAGGTGRTGRTGTRPTPVRWRMPMARRWVLEDLGSGGARNRTDCRKDNLKLVEASWKASWREAAGYLSRLQQVAFEEGKGVAGQAQSPSRLLFFMFSSKNARLCQCFYWGMYTQATIQVGWGLRLQHFSVSPQ